MSSIKLQIQKTETSKKRNLTRKEEWEVNRQRRRYPQRVNKKRQKPLCLNFWAQYNSRIWKNKKGSHKYMTTHNEAKT